ncbi:MAG: hypothetical protein K0R21_572 [Anaerocolumna sp.]|jgi:hypothetical protein|nr:hypothetical protein [Anaerocolumna sp.]
MQRVSKIDLEVVNDALYAHRLWNDSDNSDIAHPNDAAYLVCDSIPRDKWIKFDVVQITVDNPDIIME